jgi:hypothetical protein
VGGTVWLAQSVSIARGQTAGFHLAYGSLAVCPLTPRAGRATFFVCGGTQIGSLRTSVAGVGAPPQGSAPVGLIVDLTAEAHVRHPIVGPLFAALGLGFVVPAVRDGFTLRVSPTDSRVVFRAAPVGAVAGTAETAFGISFP